MSMWDCSKKIWEGQDVFIIGGGVSLSDFDFEKLKDKNVIGCNYAYKLGKDIVDVCFFGDRTFFGINKEELSVFEGLVFASSPVLAPSKVKKANWLNFIDRKMFGCHKGYLGWNYNTGASAINLALILGAKTVYLLGFDLGLSEDGKSNWHDYYKTNSKEKDYPRFQRGFRYLKGGIEKSFPNAKVINVSNKSHLSIFPSIKVEEMWPAQVKIKEEKIEVEVQEEEDINDSAVNKAYIGIRKKKKYIKK